MIGLHITEWGKDISLFFKTPRLNSWAHPVFNSVGTIFLSQGQNDNINHSHPSSADVSEWIYTSSPPYVFVEWTGSLRFAF